jgi:SAM-dependent methyltransferase
LGELDFFESIGMLPMSAYEGKVVLDWEAGDGAFSIAMLLKGAHRAVAIDSWTTADTMPAAARLLPGFSFQQGSIQDWEAGHRGTPFDLVFSNTVTEHIGDLTSAFDTIARLLKQGGLFFNNHDNYYSPCGSHDHGFWYYGANGGVEFQGVKCWTTSQKCQSSTNHRARLISHFPWTWSTQNETELTPDSCTKCRYYKRSQPWAHLRFVDEFRSLYNDPSFLTAPRPTSSVNKITPFLLRQLLNEAGFKLAKWQRTQSTNQPDQEILDLGFSPLDLTTQTVMTLCVLTEHAPLSPPIIPN